MKDAVKKGTNSMTNDYSWSIPDRNEHYCKCCETTFEIKIHEYETGDFILVCPKCSHGHYRYFELGIAKHCEITKARREPIKIMGRNMNSYDIESERSDTVQSTDL